MQPAMMAAASGENAMSEPLVVVIPHRLGKEEALRRIKPALGKASSSFPMLAVEQETWAGDRMTFRVRAMGQVAAGSVEVAEDNVRLEVTLPWLLQKFAQAVQKTIAGRGRMLLDKK
jgi:hypothetical protein